MKVDLNKFKRLAWGEDLWAITNVVRDIVLKENRGPLEPTDGAFTDTPTHYIKEAKLVRLGSRVGSVYLPITPDEIILAIVLDRKHESEDDYDEKLMELFINSVKSEFYTLSLGLEVVQHTEKGMLLANLGITLPSILEVYPKASLREDGLGNIVLDYPDLHSNTMIDMIEEGLCLFLT